MIDQEDQATFLYISRIIQPTDADMNLIYTIYKKYVNANAAPYTVGCANCSGSNSIVTYWRTLTKWFQENR